MSIRPSTRTELRKKGYKTGVDVDDARKRREDNLVEIRKYKREDNLLKKRRESLLKTGPEVDSTSHGLLGPDKKLERLPTMILALRSGNDNLQLAATTQFRKLLSDDRFPPIEEVIMAGVIPLFVEFLSRSDLPQLQFEAAWSLTNVVAGNSEHTRVVIDHGAVPKFVQLLSSPSADVRELAVWALGNIAADSTSLRDLVLQNGALMPLLAQLNERSKISMLRNAAWTLSNFCRGKPPAPFEQTRATLPVLKRLIHSTDDVILADACWALSYLSDGSNDKIQALIAAGICPKLVQLLLHPSPTVTVPALRALGNIVAGDDSQTQCIIDKGALPFLFQLLTQNHEKSIKRDACWTISNITAGTSEQIQAVIDANIIIPLAALLQNAEFDIKTEAAWAISNAASRGTNEQIHYLARQGCIKPLCDFLICTSPRILTVCLEALEKILSVGEVEKEAGRTNGINIYARTIEECQGLDKLESLQDHDNCDIYRKTMMILEKYWVEEDEEESNGEKVFEFGHGAATNAAPHGGFKFF